MPSLSGWLSLKMSLEYDDALRLPASSLPNYLDLFLLSPTFVLGILGGLHLSSDHLVQRALSRRLLFGGRFWTFGDIFFPSCCSGSVDCRALHIFFFANGKGKKEMNCGEMRSLVFSLTGRLVGSLHVSLRFG